MTDVAVIVVPKSNIRLMKLKVAARGAIFDIK